MNLNELREKNIKELTSQADKAGIENASGMKKHELIFALLTKHASSGEDIFGEGVLEILPDGFGFLRSPGYNYLPGADDIYVSPSQIRRFGLRTGDTINGEIRPPKDRGEIFCTFKS
jgi:transcription termination factor Rho